MFVVVTTAYATRFLATLAFDGQSADRELISLPPVDSAVVTNG
jgi:hypothetical protein